MKKTLLTITALGALAIPVGMVSAQTDDTPDPTPPTTVLCEQAQVRLRDGTGEHAQLRERIRVEECDGCGDMVRTQTRERSQAHLQTQVGDQIQTRDHIRDQDQIRDQVRDQDQDQTRDQIRDQDQVRDQLHDGTGNQARTGR